MFGVIFNSDFFRGKVDGCIVGAFFAVQCFFYVLCAVNATHAAYLEHDFLMDDSVSRFSDGVFNGFLVDYIWVVFYDCLFSGEVYGGVDYAV